LQLCVWKIAALFQAFGLSAGSCGLANVLQGAVEFIKVDFYFCFQIRDDCRSKRFFNLAANDGNMNSWGVRSDSLSRYNYLNAR